MDISNVDMVVSVAVGMLVVILTNHLMILLLQVAVEAVVLDTHLGKVVLVVVTLVDVVIMEEQDHTLLEVLEVLV